MLYVEGRSQGVQLSGYVSRPEDGRAWSRAFYFFLSGRPIGNRLLWKALNEAFKGVLMKNSYPVGALFLDVQPDQVDVNVHPTKQEVRFHHPESIYRLVYHAVQRGLEAINITLSERGQTTEYETAFPISALDPRREISLNAPQVSRELPLSWISDSIGNSLKTPANAGPEPVIFQNQVHGVSKSDTEASPLEDLRVLGQLARSYILAEGRAGLVVVDQHAAHEGLIFKRLEQEFAQAEGLTAQHLAFPEILERGPEDLARLPDVCPILNQIGILVEPFGDSQITIRAVPDFLASGPNARAIVTGLMDRVLSHPLQDTNALLHELLASMACHSAIKANHPLELQEMKALLRELDSEGVNQCPHGRPVIQVLEFSEIERRFRRK